MASALQFNAVNEHRNQFQRIESTRLGIDSEESFFMFPDLADFLNAWQVLFNSMQLGMGKVVIASTCFFFN
jgi:hypothetical protein